MTISSGYSTTAFERDAQIPKGSRTPLDFMLEDFFNFISMFGHSDVEILFRKLFDAFAFWHFSVYFVGFPARFHGQAT